MILASAFLVFVGCGGPTPIDRPPAPELCETVFDGVPVEVECDLLTPCKSNSECGTGFFCLNDKFCASNCSSDEQCNTGEICDIRGRCVNPLPDPDPAVCPAYFGGVITTEYCDNLTACEADEDCSTGTFCLNGSYNYCASACFTDSDCDDFLECDSNGRCSNPDQLPICQEESVTPNRVRPNIVFIVDASGSMDDNDFPKNSGTTRFEAVQEALVGTNGVVQALEDVANFSAVVYTQNGNETDGTFCAELDGVAFSANNANDINQLFEDTDPNGWTPTGEAIEEILEDTLADLPTGGPTVFVLATDGLPNGCDRGRQNRDFVNSVNAVANARANGISTYVLGVSLQADHLQDLAEAGGTDEYWTAETPAQLSAALNEIILNSVVCNIHFNEMVDLDLTSDGCVAEPEASSVTVTLGGEVIECDDDYSIDAGRTSVTLTGDACDRYKEGLEFDADFPCGALVPAPDPVLDPPIVVD